MSNFKQRVFLSTVFILILAAAIYLSAFEPFRPFFTLLVILVAGSSLWEYYQMSRQKGIEPVSAAGIVGSAFYLYTLFLATQSLAYTNLPVIVLALTVMASFLYFFNFGKNPLVNLAVTVFGVAYITLPLGALIPINFSFGKFWFIYLLIVTKFTDIGSYFCGKILGRRKLAPFISPKKSWEGACGGFLFGLLSSIGLYFLSHKIFEGILNFTLFQSIWLGAILSLLAIIGDLCESLLKRDSGIKDSSQLPGLGGMLDIVDSLIFTAPVLYFYLIMMASK